jgi:CDP-diacylglycerol--serine O-phosphatidyltransferase
MPPLKYLVPNSFTALSLLLGLASITMAVEGNYELAAWMILWGTLLDKLDGSAARLFNATSKFGMEFDSFADFVSFGIAPAALVYFRLVSTGHWEGWHRTALMAAAGLFVLALAVRLARFNIASGGEKIFYGVPGTLVGATGASGYLTWSKYGLDESLLAICPAFLVIFAVLMVCSLRLPKLIVRKSKALNVFQYGNVMVAYIIGPMMLFPEYLFALALLYLVGGLIVGFLVPPVVEDEDTDEPQEQLA